MLVIAGDLVIPKITPRQYFPIFSYSIIVFLCILKEEAKRRKQQLRDTSFLKQKQSWFIMLSLERIPDQVGYLVLAEDGAVVASGGELENDEQLASHITELIYLSEVMDQTGTSKDDKFQKISVVFEDYSLVICLSNKRIHVVKRRIPPPETLASAII